MNFSPLVKLNVACGILSLFAASAFIGSNYLLLVLNQIGITIVLWVRVIQARCKAGKVNYPKICGSVIPPFVFITMLSIGSHYSDNYTWHILIFSVALLVGLYRYFEKSQNNLKDY